MYTLNLQEPQMYEAHENITLFSSSETDWGPSAWSNEIVKNKIKKMLTV